MWSGRPVVVIISRFARFGAALEVELAKFGYVVSVLQDKPTLSGVGISPSTVCIIVDADPSLRPFLDVAAFARSYRFTGPMIALCEKPSIKTAVALIKGGAVDVMEVDRAAVDAAAKVHAVVISHGANLKPATQSKKIEVLTAKENEVLEYVLGGFKSKEIAQLLNVSRRTVEEYRSSAMKKVGARNVAELASKILRKGP